jgi:hypothetical protein
MKGLRLTFSLLSPAINEAKITGYNDARVSPAIRRQVSAQDVVRDPKCLVGETGL